eukprot:7938437-Alexandrium_andersonii.AAC.1
MLPKRAEATAGRWRVGRRACATRRAMQPPTSTPAWKITISVATGRSGGARAGPATHPVRVRPTNWQRTR